ncbi:hypothetical protein K9U39_04185 [Rhodoblastus acidophilus]|uniref:Uncharacterized protein n=1 Tax=Candidatus Rhodoblastus alkanivorans TaxID=2954117 RepID=A0ABS9Z588_9HYPH|nr:hypothetical protein [Candidatus Rhodoblastus alkanivorans]MCI4678483.1 hypothetical protein [Candidatus Rhodoblastus alkanivorans]MCI4682844.1 hypothetical protein [Candidatus Rhodoblastus alkanivorans]MDI4640153.1 hypothetical protein [Rhodoblastus acidophilus]
MSLDTKVEFRAEALPGANPSARRNEWLKLQCLKGRGGGDLRQFAVGKTCVLFRSLSNKIPVIHIFALFFAFFRLAQAAAHSPESNLIRAAPERIREPGESRMRKSLL